MVGPRLERKPPPPWEKAQLAPSSVIMSSLSVGPWGQNSSMTVALVKRSFFSAHKQGHPLWTVLTETSFDVFLCKLLLGQHVSAANQALIPSCTYSFDIKYTSWGSRGTWGPRQARRALVRESEKKQGIRNWKLEHLNHCIFKLN